MSDFEQKHSPEHEGERYLQLLGLGEFANTVIQTDHGPLEARNFLELCGDEARPQLETFATLSQDHPRYASIRLALRSIVMVRINQGLDS